MDDLNGKNNVFLLDLTSLYWFNMVTIDGNGIPSSSILLFYFFFFLSTFLLHIQTFITLINIDIVKWFQYRRFRSAAAALAPFAIHSSCCWYVQGVWIKLGNAIKMTQNERKKKYDAISYCTYWFYTIQPHLYLFFSIWVIVGRAHLVILFLFKKYGRKMQASHFNIDKNPK